MTGITAAAGGAAAAGASLLSDPGTQNYSALAFDPTNARSGVRLMSGGNIEQLQNFAYSTEGQWRVGGIGSNYEARVTVVSGTLDIGLSAGVWYTLSAAREWGIQTEVNNETDTAQLTVDIRRIAVPSDAIQFTVNLSAQRTPI